MAKRFKQIFENTTLKFYSNSEEDASIKGENEALESLTDN